MVWGVEMFCPHCMGDCEESGYFTTKKKAKDFIEGRKHLEVDRFEKIKKSELPAWADISE